MNAEFFELGHSCDCWAFPVPIPHIEGMDFRVGNQLGCDGHAVVRVVQAGLRPVNDAIKHRVVHVDRCAHRGRADCTIFKTAEMNKSAEATSHAHFTDYGQLRVLLCGDDDRAKLRLCTFARQSLPQEQNAESERKQREAFGEDGGTLLLNGRRVFE